MATDLPATSEVLLQTDASKHILDQDGIAGAGQAARSLSCASLDYLTRMEGTTGKEVR